MVGELPALTLREKILLWLSHLAPSPSEGPGLSSTQAGIATATGMSRGNVSRTLAPLASRGLVALADVRVPGFTRVLKAYGLTEAGAHEAELIAATVRHATVPVRRGGSEAGNLRIGEALKLASRMSLWDALIAIETHGHLDLEGGRVSAALPRFAFEMTDAPPPLPMFGRDREVEDIATWTDTLDSRLLLVVAPAGMGKSTLMAEAVRARRPRAHVVWIRLTDGMGPDIMLEPLRRVLEGMGRQAQAAGHDPASLQRALARAMHGLPMLVVVDDGHKATASAQGVLAALAETALREPTARLAVISRSMALPELIAREASVLHVHPLSDTDAKRMLEARGVPAGTRARIVEAAGGNPLFLRLMAQGRTGAIAPSVDFSGYLSSVVSSSLAPDEVRALRALAACRANAPPDAIEHAVGEPGMALARLAQASLATARPDGQYDLHDLVREAVYHEIPPEERLRIHRRLAEAFRPVAGRPAAVEEYLFHLVRAGRRDEAVGWILTHQHLLLARAREVFAEGEPISQDR